MIEILPIEEYIYKRKKEDMLNEFDADNKTENIKNCVNYVFEYFNNYLTITDLENKTAIKEEKLDRYRKLLIDYDVEVREWLVEMYSEHGNYMNRNIGSLLQQETYFFLLNKESEFRSLSYDCYAKLIKRFPFLKGQTELLFLFVKEYQRVESNKHNIEEVANISENIGSWLETTQRKYNVNLYAFAYYWAHWFFDNQYLWGKDKTRRKVSYEFYDYNYRNNLNVFNIDRLYRNMPKKVFTKGRKQEFEILVMYVWTSEIYGNDDGYWEEYLEKVLNNN